MPLTDQVCKTLKPKSKKTKHFDGEGLYLEVSPAGGKHWRVKYRFGGKEKLLTLGSYPHISLKDARVKTSEAKSMILEGVDPSKEKQKAKQELQSQENDTFKEMALRRHKKYLHTFDESYAEKRLRRLEQHVFPLIGHLKMREIKLKNLRQVVDSISEVSLDVSKRALHQINEVYQESILEEVCDRNLAHDLKGIIPPAEGGHLAAVTDPSKVGEMLIKLRDYKKGSRVTRAALKIAPLTFMRPGELRHGKWEEIDFDKKRWSITAKGGVEHVIPLSTQTIQHLKELRPYTQDSEYIFAGARDKSKPMSENTVNMAMRRCGISQEEMCGHGFRAMARTILDEELEFNVVWIEQQLAHQVRDHNGRAYNRTKHLRQRTEMMQAWADYLDQLIQEALSSKISA